MISLARQLALRREIEEELGELAGHASANDDHLVAAFRKLPTDAATRERLARIAWVQRQKTRPPCKQCGKPRAKGQGLQFCGAPCARAFCLARRRKRHRTKRPLGTCACGAPLTRANAKRCPPCGAEHDRLRRREYVKQWKRRRRSAQARRAA